jgi:hypothetical protein
MGERVATYGEKPFASGRTPTPHRAYRAGVGMHAVSPAEHEGAVPFVCLFEELAITVTEWEVGFRDAQARGAGIHRRAKLS